jgi:hypothetical protein
MWWMGVIATAVAGVQVPVQGALTDGAGAPVEGTRAVEVALSPNADGSGPLWSDELDVAFAGGGFALTLGDGDDLPASFFRDHPTLYLVLSVQGLAPSTPVRLGTAPRAAFADLAASAATADLATLATDATNAQNAVNAQNADNATTFATRPIGDFVLDGDDIPWSDVDKTGAPAVVTAGLSAGTGVTVSGGEVSWGYTVGAGLRLNGTALEAKFADFDLRYAAIGSVSTNVVVGPNTAECTEANRGALRFDGTNFQGCTASGWSSLGSGGSSGGSTTAGNGTAGSPGRHCADVFAAGNTASGVYWIDVDGTTGPNPAYQQYCLHDQHSGGWGLVFNLDTNDATRRDWQDTAFWTGTSTVGNASAALTEDHKNLGYRYDTGSELMICAHNEGVMYGCAVYDVASAYGGMTFNTLFNLGNNVALTSARKAVSGSVGTFSRQRNAGDPFIDRPDAVILNSTYSPADAANLTRIGTNYAGACPTISCDGHNFGGLGGQHARGGWGTLYEGAALNGYCWTQGGYGTNGTGFSGNNAFDGFGFSGGCGGASALAPVDVAVFRRTVLGSAAFLGGSPSNAASSCNAAKTAGATSSGPYWIDPDGTGSVAAYQQYCNMTDHSGGWGLVFNLDTNDAARRDWQDTAFWQSIGVFGTATNALVEDHKNAAFQHQTGSEIMICAHNEGVRYGCAAYDLLSTYQNQPFNALMGLSNTTITAARKAVVGSVGTFSRSRNGGDPFIDRSEALIVNSTYSPADSSNVTRIGTNYAGACPTISCDGHNFGGLGGQHVRSTWGALYEASALNGYCSSQGGYGTNGTGYAVANNAFDGCSPILAPVDVAVYRR